MSKKPKQSEDARQRLRGAGLRATRARIAVLNLLAEMGNPRTHREISDRLQPLGIEKSTIFRALNDLATAGLAGRMELGDHVWRFGLATPAETCELAGGAHSHLLCVDCGSITCLTDEDIEVKAPKSIGPIEDILLKGHCASCLERK